VDHCKPLTGVTHLLDCAIRQGSSCGILQIHDRRCELRGRSWRARWRLSGRRPRGSGSASRSWAAGGAFPFCIARAATSSLRASTVSFWHIYSTAACPARPCDEVDSDDGTRWRPSACLIPWAPGAGVQRQRSTLHPAGWRRRTAPAGPQRRRRRRPWQPWRRRWTAAAALQTSRSSLLVRLSL
jgi:hypothetical protein